MPEPVDTATDLLETRADEIELVTVDSLDPDVLPPANDVLATATGVRAIAGRETGGETPVAGAAVGQARRNFTLVAGDIPFTVKNRDRITRTGTDGSVWYADDVNQGGFGALVECRDCVQGR
jgi:streptogramin lyase